MSEKIDNKMRKYSPKLAVIFSLGAAFVYAVMAMLIKMSENTIPPEMIVFFRQCVGICVILPLIFNQVGSVKELKTNRFSLYLLRAFASISAMYCLVYALKYLPLTDALLLSYTRPLFIPIVIYFWFGKKWTKHIWIGLPIGFLGVLCILKPDEKVFDLAALVGLASGMFGAVAFTAIRRLTRTEFADKILMYYAMLSLPIAAIPLCVGWKSLKLESWIYLGLIGLAGTLYEMFLIRAYRHAKAFKVGSILYATVVFGALFDWMLGNAFLDLFSIIGFVLVIAGSVITMFSPPLQRISASGHENSKS